MLSVYDTMNGKDYYKLHYSYEDMPFIDCEHAPLELSEARELFNDYIRDPRYTHVYVTKNNMLYNTELQVTAYALIEGMN